MGIEVFEPEEIELLDNALVDLGWKLDVRLTTEAAMGMKSIAEEVIWWRILGSDQVNLLI